MTSRCMGLLARSRTLRFVPALFVVAALMLSAGCKQGIGERCQINSDCEEPLVCNASAQQCQETAGTGPDASVSDAAPAIDAAPPIDAPPADAAVDAGVSDARVNDAT